MARPQGLVLLVKQVAQRAQKGVLAVKVVVKGALGGVGELDDLFYRSMLVALLIKQLPCRPYDPAPGVAGVPFCHIRRLLPLDAAGAARIGRKTMGSMAIIIACFGPQGNGGGWARGEAKKRDGVLYNLDE